MPTPPPLIADIQERLSTAQTLHKAGQFKEAEKLYRAILAADKDNAEVLGLLAHAVHRQGDTKQAKRLWRQSLAVASPACVFLRNLNNLLPLLLREGQKAEAIHLASGDIPNWPAVRIPDPGERKMLLALTDMLVMLEQYDAAARLLRGVVSSLPRDGVLLHALGKIQMLQKDMPSAWQTLSEADRALQPRISFPLLSDLNDCACALNEPGEMRTFRERIAADSPILTSPRTPGQQLNVLVLNDVQFDNHAESLWDLHFSCNYPRQIAKALKDEFNFASVFADTAAGREAANRLPRPDLIINNVANGEQIRAHGTLAELAAFADCFGVPVINPPDKVALTTRDQSIDMLAGIPGLVLPKTSRHTKAGMPPLDLARAIEAEHAYPLITRTLFLQEGKGMAKVGSREELIRVLEDDTGPEVFFVTSFVDSRGPTGYYRKIRAAVIGDEILIARADYDTDWNVHGRKSDARVAFYLSHPELLAEEDRICRNPEQELGSTAMQALQAIRGRMPLEVFGVDFDVDPDGRLVFYEANASMNLLSTARREVPHPQHAEARLLLAFRRYLQRLASRPGGRNVAEP